MAALPDAKNIFPDPVDRDIAARVLDGAPNKAIARATGLAEGTVKWRLHRMYRRLGVSSRSRFVLAVRDLLDKD